MADLASNLAPLAPKMANLAPKSCNLTRAGWDDTPSALARPGWLDLASTGSIWLPVAFLLARSGLDWLDLAAPDALAGSNWPSWAPWLARFGCSGRSWPPWLVIESQKTLSFSTVCLDAACFVRSGSYLHASNLVYIYIFIFIFIIY